VSAVLRRALPVAVERAHAPGGVAYVGRNGETLLHAAHGYRQRVPARDEAETSHLYDLASLTKVIATTTAILKLYEAGTLDLDRPVSEVIPIAAFRRFTARHLLTHTAGLPAYKPWYRELTSVDQYLERVAQIELSWPPGARRRYSDFSFIILGRMVERIAGQGLDVFCEDAIFDPLGMKHTTFNPPPGLQPACAATERCRWRNRVIVGEVHDENAYAVGGVSGHAGLFATAEDLARFSRAIIEGEILTNATLDEAATMGQVPTYPWQGLGWKIDPWRDSAEGMLPSRAAIGHTGWTGTCIWIDRDTGVFSILLSNTAHPSREGRRNRTLRKTFHLAVAHETYPRKTNVHTGIDVILRDDYEATRGKRVALLTHSAAVDQLGRRTLDALRLDTETIVSRVFTPEHGLDGQAEAGEHVGAQRAPVPVTSLYGNRKRPTNDELEGIELFLIDLQDVGARYYTYAATMLECLKACADARVPVLILDRPNPLGGDILEGPVATKFGSLVCVAPIPIRHGMTLGELALHMKAVGLVPSRLDLRIGAIDQWFPDQWFDECSLPWTPPSPNIPDPKTALLYVGMCLFEGTNMNEGRGTDTPFNVIGSPWLDADAVIARVDAAFTPGCTLESTRYTPRSIPGKATRPRFRDTACNGVRIHIENRNAARPFTTAIALLAAIHAVHGDALEWSDFFDTLAGGAWLRERIQFGAETNAILDTIAAEHTRFNRARPRRYPTRRQVLEV